MVKLKELKLKTVTLDYDDVFDCKSCQYPIGTFDQHYIKEGDGTYVICPNCGEIYKVKE